MITDRNLKPGTVLKAKYRGVEHTANVIEKEGRLVFILGSGLEFKSPSAAGKYVTGHECAGWNFWSVASPNGAPVKTVEVTTRHEDHGGLECTTTEEVEVSAEAETEAPDTLREAHEPETGTYKFRSQKGAPLGQARWYCFDCSEPFHAPVRTKKAECPLCHNAASKATAS